MTGDSVAPHRALLHAARRRNRIRRAFGWACWAIGVGWVAWGCQEPRDHPPPLPACEGPSCVQIPPRSSGGATGADRATIDVPSDQRTNVTGEVRRIASDDFDIETIFGEPAEIRAEGAGGREVTAQWDGVNPFELQDVALGQQVWFGVFPANPVSVDAMPTIEPFDTRSGGDVVLHVIAGSVLDQIYSLLTNPTTRAPGTAQVVLQFVHESDRRKLSNVQVTVPGAEAIVYDAAGTYSDSSGATGVEGVAIVVNLPTATTRDQSISIAGPLDASHPIRVAPDAVTFAEVRLSF